MQLMKVVVVLCGVTVCTNILRMEDRCSPVENAFGKMMVGQSSSACLEGISLANNPAACARAATAACATKYATIVDPFGNTWSYPVGCNSTSSFAACPAEAGVKNALIGVGDYETVPIPCGGVGGATVCAPNYLGYCWPTVWIAAPCGNKSFGRLAQCSEEAG